MKTFWEIVTDNSTLAIAPENTFWDHINNQKTGGGTTKEIRPSGIASSVSFGIPVVSLERIINIIPVGIASTSAVGTPTLFILSPNIEIAPIERTLTAEKENRNYEIKQENRVYTMAKESREFSIEVEDRTFNITAEGKIMKKIIKDPDARLNYTFNFTDWLETGDIISTFQLIESSGITVESQTNTDTKVTAIISGGAKSGEESLTCRITTQNSLVEDRTIIFEMEER